MKEGSVSLQDQRERWSQPPASINTIPYHSSAHLVVSEPAVCHDLGAGSSTSYRAPPWRSGHSLEDSPLQAHWSHIPLLLLQFLASGSLELSAL